MRPPSRLAAPAPPSRSRPRQPRGLRGAVYTPSPHLRRLSCPQRETRTQALEDDSQSSGCLFSESLPAPHAGLHTAPHTSLRTALLRPRPRAQSAQGTGPANQKRPRGARYSARAAWGGAGSASALRLFRLSCAWLSAWSWVSELKGLSAAFFGAVRPSKFGGLPPARSDRSCQPYSRRLSWAVAAACGSRPKSVALRRPSFQNT